MPRWLRFDVSWPTSSPTATCWWPTGGTHRPGPARGVGARTKPSPSPTGPGCDTCGGRDHRDANAATNLATLGRRQLEAAGIQVGDRDRPGPSEENPPHARRAAHHPITGCAGRSGLALKREPSTHRPHTLRRDQSGTVQDMGQSLRKRVLRESSRERRIPAERHKTNVRPGACGIRTPDLTSYTCSIERLIDPVFDQLVQTAREGVSVAAVRHRFDSRSARRPEADRHFPRRSR